MNFIVIQTLPPVAYKPYLYSGRREEGRGKARAPPQIQKRKKNTIYKSYRFQTHTISLRNFGKTWHENCLLVKEFGTDTSQF